MIRSLKDILVVSDMDNTLLTPEDGVPFVNQVTMRLFCALGGHFTVATGRTMESAGRHLDSMTLSAPAILYGGGVIYDFEHDIRIRNTLLSKPSARRAVCDVLARFPGVGVEIMTEDGGICVVRANEYTYRHTVHEGLTYRMAPLEELDGGWNKVLFACSHEMLMQIQDFLDARKYPGVYFIATNRNYFEIMPEGAAKGAALGELCTYMGIPIENTVAIGDYFNDIELMRAAGHSVAMGNAPKEVQLAADTVTGRCLDGGVASAVPVDWAIEQGYEKIVVVLTRQKGYRKKPVGRTMLRLYQQKYRDWPLLVEALRLLPVRYNELHAQINRLERAGRIFVIRPKGPVQVSRVEKDVGKLKALYEEGRRTAEEQLPAMLEYLNK